MIEINFGLHQAGQLSALLSSLLVSLTACYFVWRQALSRKYEPSYLRLGHKQSPNLREIVETQWREVRRLTEFFLPVFQSTPNTAPAEQGTEVSIAVAIPPAARSSQTLCQ